MNEDNRVKRSRAEIQELLELWKCSGKTKKDFAQEMGIKYMTLVYWCKKFDSAGQPEDSGKFTPLKLINPDPCGAFAEIQFLSGNKIIFHQAVTVDYFQKLLQ